MSIMKRATKKLTDAGLAPLQIKKFFWGYSVYDPRLLKQRGRCYKTIARVLEEVLENNERPVDLTNETGDGREDQV